MKKLSKTINGDARTGKKKLAALCEALGLPSSYFLELPDFVIEVKIKNEQTSKTKS